ncbi:hypothetical protein [Noviherbaspirillum pedocola]|uniref:Uncharacterized protein n=1 Tax=Noviherbaspirillum pedocola TaxID=2801341 RepID=A0A934SY41_9BURK|nr:hypothetical protein [Noviherbaspirillum pedocola]MBK4737872.1 hypothetical protein [Noviherbaspirillum pedocola]
MTTQTGNDGTYAFQLPSSVLNFVVEVSTATGAMMADEATGQDIALPAGMKLRSVVNLAAAATTTYKAAVSPFTEMVARAAESAGGGKLTSQAVQQAKEGVRTLLGFDPETVQPVNANSDAAAGASEDEKNQSLMLAAISQMAKDSSLNCAQTAPADRIACVVDKVAGSVTIQNGVTVLDASSQAPLRDALNEVASDATINHTGKTTPVGIPLAAPASTPNPSSTDAQPSPTQAQPVPTPANPVEAAKALFGSLRTNLQSINADNALTNTISQIKTDLQNGVAPAGGNVADTFALAQSAIAYLNSYQANPAMPTSLIVTGNVAHTGSFAPYGQPISNGYGNCEVQASPLSITCNVITDAALSDPNYVYVPLGPQTQTYLNRTITLTPQADGIHFDYAASTQKGSVTYTWDNATHTYVKGAPIVNPVGNAAQGTLTYAQTDASLVQLSLHGTMPGRFDHTGAVIDDSENWDFDATRADLGNNVYQYNFGGKFAALKGGQTVGTMNVDPSSHLRLNMVNGVVAQDNANELYLVMNGGTGTTGANGKLTLSRTQADKNGLSLMPTSLVFQGALQKDGVTVFTGNVSIARQNYSQFDTFAPVTASNFPVDAAFVSGQLSVPNRPKIGLNVGVTRLAIDATNMTAQYNDGTSVVNATVTARAGAAPLVKVQSSSGVAFSFTDTTQNVDVTKDGATVAKLDLGKGIVYYADGAYESLK